MTEAREVLRTATWSASLGIARRVCVLDNALSCLGSMWLRLCRHLLHSPLSQSQRANAGLCAFVLGLCGWRPMRAVVFK